MTRLKFNAFWRLGLVALAALLLIAPAGAQEEREWITLFDGSSLDAWRGYQREDVPEQWKIEGDTLTRTGGSADLITREEFGDFDLRFEWKIAPGGNSGVIYRCTEDAVRSYMTGPEYQLLDDEAHRDGRRPETSTAALYALYPRSSDPTKPAGEWNTGRIVVDDGRVEHWLNGERVVQAQWGGEDWKRRVADSKFAAWDGFAQHEQGRIALQDHGAPVWFRNIRVARLDDEPAAQASGDRPARVLFVTQSEGFEHSTISRKSSDLSHTERIMQELGVKSGEFRVDCTKDVANDFTPELLENYDVVMFYTTGDLPIPEETRQWFLNDWLKQEGHGFLGVHSAADTYHDYEPYWDMLGGTFVSHPWTANATVTVTVHDPSHPAAEPWGEEFVITDEIYRFRNWQPEKARVLMSLNMAKTDLKKPYHVPVLWVKEYGDGRVMHMSLGHREDVWTNPKYQQSLINGIRWLLGEVEGDAAPNPQVSAAEEQKARRAAQQAG